MDDPAPAAERPSFGDALRAWLYVGLNSFGGPAGQIAVMHREIVERRGWLPEQGFLQGLNFAMLLPGPEAQQLATFIGWRLHGLRGALAAGLLFILPGVVAMLALSVVYAVLQGTPPLEALFYGIKPAVVAVVLAAVLKLGRRVLRRPLDLAIAGAAFVAIFFFDVAFPLIIAGAALAGWLVGRRAQREPSPSSSVARPPTRRGLIVLTGALVLWLLPTLVVLALAGPDSVFGQLAVFFSIAALVTFGGAYAVLAFVAQQAVTGYGWLAAEQMLDGLGMAESTPGPLIMVVQFVGFMAAFAAPAGLDPLVAATIGGLLVTWVTFVPSFGFIVAGAPYVAYLEGRPQVSAALGGITAAVVGVIANLGLWFALQTLFVETGELRLGLVRLHTVEVASLDVVALGLVAVGLLLLVRLRWPLMQTLGLSAALGFAYHLAFAG
jgi:chromate transporter